MDGYKPHRILIWIGFLCQRNKASSSSHRCRVCSPRIKLFSPTLPSTHFALNPPSRIHSSPTNGKPTLHTHTASLPGPRGPGSYDSDLTRPARPSVPVTSPLDHSPMPGAHPLRPSASPRRPSPSGDQGTCHRHRGTCPRLRRAPSIPSAASGLPLRPTPSRTRHLDHRAQAHGSRPSSRPKKPIVVVLDSTRR